MSAEDYFDAQSEAFWDWVHANPDTILEWVREQELITVELACDELDKWAMVHEDQALFLNLKSAIQSVREYFELFKKEADK